MRTAVFLLLFMFSAFLPNASSAQGCTAPPPGIVAWWPGEGTADDLVDGHHGTLVGGVFYDTGKVGQAFHTDGFNDYVNIPGDLELFFANDEAFTVDAWFKAESEVPAFFVMRNAAYGIKWNGVSQPLAFYNGEYHYSTKTDWELGRWYHVALVDDGATYVRLYVDGVIDKSDEGLLRNPNRFPIRPGSGYLFAVQIGAWNEADGGGYQFFNGLVDEVRIYDRALAAYEIQALYEADSAGACQCVDNDSDGYGSLATFTCSNGTEWDCNDADFNTHPGSAEICDGYDNDCSGLLDDDPTCNTSCSDPEKIGSDSQVSTGVSGSRQPSLAWNGSGYGVAWEDKRGGTFDIYFARLDSNGNRIGDDIRVTTTGGELPSLVWTGSQYGLAFISAASGVYEVYLGRLDRNGIVIDVTQVSSTLSNSYWPSLVWSGAEYGLVWRDHWVLYFARLSADGAKMGDDLALSEETGMPDEPSLAWTGRSYGVAWDDTRHGNSEIYFAQIDSVGNKIGDDIRITSDTDYSMRPSLVWSGDSYGLAYFVDRGWPDEIALVLLDSNGIQVGQTTIVTDQAGDSSPASLSWTGSVFGVIWYRSWLRLNLFDESGVRIGQDVRVSDETSSQTSVTWIGDGFTVSFSDFQEPSNSEIFLSRVGCSCTDGDGDSVSVCNDCDDTNQAVYPAASQVCDGVNNDCMSPVWPDVAGTNEGDDDLDGTTECSGDCDDGNSAVYPDAPQLCDGINNNCDDASWPLVPLSEIDNDSDGFAECNGDCNDGEWLINPGAVEICNAIDDNCNALTDEDELGEDTDSDTIHNLCDNCPLDANPSQPDSDGDDHGDACDNCVSVKNPGQSDLDDDSEGDHCDLDDGLIYVFVNQTDLVEWQEELGFTKWNAYRGDLFVLKSTGVYTQDPATVPLARRECKLRDAWIDDTVVLIPDQAAFYLTTGVSGSVESDLGTDSFGIPRPHTNPCP